MVFGYTRVSSIGQLEGNGLKVQKKEILEKYENAKIVEEQFSGKTTDRPILNKLMKELQKGDTLVVTKLDRLARNTKEGIEIVEELFDKGVSVHVLNVGLLENSSMGKFFTTTLLAVAEMERSMILERTQAGKELAKKRDDFREGRPKKFSREHIQNALSLLENNSYTQVTKMTGISKSTLIRAKKSNNNVE